MIDSTAGIVITDWQLPRNAPLTNVPYHLAPECNEPDFKEDDIKS